MDGVCINPVTHKPQREILNGSGDLAGTSQDCWVVAVAWSYPSDFDCTGLACETSLHIEQRSFTYISPPKELYCLH